MRESSLPFLLLLDLSLSQMNFCPLFCLRRPFFPFFTPFWQGQIPFKSLALIRQVEGALPEDLAIRVIPMLPGSVTTKIRSRAEEEVHYLRRFLLNPMNIAILIVGASFPFFYLFSDTRAIEAEMWPNTYTPEPSQVLQDFFGTEGLFAFLMSHFYIHFKFVTIFSFYFVIYFAERERRNGKARPAWVYGASFLSFQAINLTIWYFFPVAPPIRWISEGSDVTAIRGANIDYSDQIITYYYSAWPSNHMSTAIAGIMIAHMSGQRKFEAFYIFDTLINSFCIVYLGEHYWMDALGTAIFIPLLLTVGPKLYDQKGPYADREDFWKWLASGQRKEQLARDLNQKSPYLLLFIFPFLFYILKMDQVWILAGCILLVPVLLALEWYHRKISHSDPDLGDVDFLFATKANGSRPLQVLTVILALIFSLAVFPYPVVEIAIFSVFAGDFASSIGEIGFGRHQLPLTRRRTVEGAVSGFLVASLVSGLFLVFHKINETLFEAWWIFSWEKTVDASWNRIFVLSLAVGAVVAGTYFLEGRRPFFLDDNFLNIVIASMFIYMVLLSVQLYNPFNVHAGMWS
jgi:dolichol kinase